MWFERYKIEAIEQGLINGQKSGLLSILPPEGFIANPNPSPFCPKCGKAFISKKLNFIFSVVPSCPEGHGVWLTQDVIGKIRRLLKGDAVPQHIYKQRASFRVFVFCMAIGLLVFNGIQRFEKKESGYSKMVASMPHAQKVGASYWPGRDFTHWNLLPVYQDVIVDADELSYVQKWINFANTGIVNRLNMHDALLVKRPALEYLEAYNFFAERQSMMLSDLKGLTPPKRLEVFHDGVVAAIASQIDFYDDFVRQKIENPSIELSHLLEHPKLVDCDQRLWAAFYEFARIYPNRDAATNNAIEQRLNWLDLI